MGSLKDHVREHRAECRQLHVLLYLISDPANLKCFGLPPKHDKHRRIGSHRKTHFRSPLGGQPVVPRSLPCDLFKSESMSVMWALG